MYLNNYINKSPYNKSKNNQVFIRKQSDDEINLFINTLKAERWEMVDDFNSGKLTVEELCDNFLNSYINLWHYCSPLVNKIIKVKK